MTKRASPLLFGAIAIALSGACSSREGTMSPAGTLGDGGIGGGPAGRGGGSGGREAAGAKGGGDGSGGAEDSDQGGAGGGPGLEARVDAGGDVLADAGLAHPAPGGWPSIADYGAHG